MIPEQTIGQKKALQVYQDIYEYNKNSEVLKKWREQNRRSKQFHYGDSWKGRYESIELEDLAKKMDNFGYIPMSVNKIEPKIQTYQSLLVANKKRTGVNSTTDLKKHKQEAENLKNLFINIATQTQSDFEDTQAFKDAAIGGLGCILFRYNGNPQFPFTYECYDPEEIIPDADDHSKRYNRSNNICRRYFLPATQCKKNWPKYAKFFEDMVSAVTQPDDSYNDHDGNDIYDESWSRGKSICIIEVYYKKNVEYYQGKAIIEPSSDEMTANPQDDSRFANEQTFQCFDEDFAKARHQNQGEGDYITLEGTQIWKGIFCQDILLESGPIEGQVPNQDHFPIQLICLDRDHKGVPRGIVEGLIPLNIAYNYVYTKSLHMIGSKHLITSDKSQDLAKKNLIYAQLNSPTGIIYAENPKDVQLIYNQGNQQFALNLISLIEREIDRRTQIYDELEGDRTNVTSGVGIREKSQNSARNQVTLQTAYEHFRVSMGRLMLNTIQGIRDLQYTFNYLKGNKVNYASLDDEVSLMNFEVYPDIIPNYASSNEELSAKFETIINMPNADAILGVPKYLEVKGFSESQALDLHDAYVNGQLEKAELMRKQQEILQAGQQPDLPQA